MSHDNDYKAGMRDMGAAMSAVRDIDKAEKDHGAHYRQTYKGIQLDPFRIARVYKMDCPALFTILKKCLMAGRRGYKDKRQDLNDIISAAQRELQIMTEDNE